MILSSGREELRAIPTFSEFVRDLYVPFAMNAKRSWRTDETVLRIQVLPTISRLPLDQVTTAIIADLLSRMARKGYAAGTMNRVLVLLRLFMFNLANKWKVPGAPSNPTVARLVNLTALDRRGTAEGSADRLGQGLGAVNDE